MARRERLVWRCPRMLRSRFPTLSKLCRTSHCPSWQTLVQDTCSPSLSSLLLVFCGLHVLVRGVVGVCFSPFLTPLFSWGTEHHLCSESDVGKWHIFAPFFDTGFFACRTQNLCICQQRNTGWLALFCAKYQGCSSSGMDLRNDHVVSNLKGGAANSTPPLFHF